jgi:hypothetical protein
MSIARSVVFIEVRAGRMPDPKNLVCTDCGAPARCYDHRDYMRPLDVQPVCWVCNKKRGRGKNREGLDGDQL